MTCPSCRSEVPAGARFCPDCGQDLRLRGDERRVVTVLFADLVGFTGLAETRDPEQVKNLVDSCFERLVADIDAFGGRVDKIVGDAIVALFGAPTAHEDDAERAVRAALRMQATLAEIAESLSDAVQMRIGVNTGEVLVGALRAGGDYTAMGDVVNTASRLQAAADPGTVLVGPATHSATHRVVDFEALEPMRVKGRAELVPVWRAIEALAPPGYRPDRVRATLTGREAEMGLLGHSIDNSTRNSRAALLLVLGEAGVGKSRLAEELAQKAACDNDALVLEGRCVPYGEANVWWPIADALRHGAGIRSTDDSESAIGLAHASVRRALGDDVAEGEVDEVLQGLLYLMGYESDLRTIEPARARGRAIDAAVRYAESFSLHRPVVVVLSDLHWADDVVLEMIDTMLDRLANRRFVVIATARPVIEERWHPPHGRHNLVALTLDPLTGEAAAALLRELAGHDLGAELAGALLERSGGNPFYLEELVTLLSDAGMVGSPSAGAAQVELPATLRGLVAARLDSLSAHERQVLDDCTVLGRRGPVSAIEVMAAKRLGIADVRPILESLQAKDLLVLSGAGTDAKWTFRSDLVREVAYGTLTKAVRARSHQSVAAWMEIHSDTERDAVVDQITNHYVRAAELAEELGPVEGLFDDLKERALAWVERAVDRADQADTHVVAERLFGEGLRLLAGEQGPRHRAFLTGRARALAGLRELAPARADVAEAVAEGRLAGASGEAQLAQSLLVLADIEQKEACWSAAEEALAEADALFARIGDERGRAEVLRMRGFGALFRHAYTEATELLEQARSRFEALGDQRGVAWALQNLAWCTFYSGRPEAAEIELREAAALFEEIGDPGGLAWARGLLAWTRFQQGFAEEAGEMAESILRHALRGGDRWARGMLLTLAGSVRLWSGHTRAAIEQLSEARELFQAMDDAFGLVQSTSHLARALVMAGNVSEGVALATSQPELPVGGEANPWTGFLAPLTALASTVQVGDVATSRSLLASLPLDLVAHLDELGEGVAASSSNGLEAMVGLTEVTTSVAVLRLHEGDVDGALRLLLWFDGQSEGADPNLHAITALAQVAAGATDAARRAAAEVEGHPRATYLDRLTAGTAAGLALARQGEGAASTARFDQLRAAADATEDRIAQALVRLAGAAAASALGVADAAEKMADAEARLAEMGLLDTAWRRTFSLGLGLSPAT